MKKFDYAVSKLKSLHAKLLIDEDDIYNEIVSPKEQVFSRFQPVFSLEYVSNLSEIEFKEFLLFENNKHWSGLHRLGPKICSDMGRLKDTLMVLLDESKPISERVDFAIENVKGLGKAIITAILLVSFPDKYGVWNNTSEGALKILGIWPEFNRGESFGNKYVKVNDLLLSISEKLEVDLWAIDVLWWRVKFKDDFEDVDSLDFIEQIQTEKNQRFGLEKHLHEFLRDNWDHTSIGEEWDIYSDESDEELGFEYPCDVGRIDILAHHKTEPKWLVIELKRNQTSDQTVGQLLRYIGWVQTHLCEDKSTVQGLIIAHAADEAIKYALKPISNVALQLYEVEFKLVQV